MSEVKEKKRRGAIILILLLSFIIITILARINFNIDWGYCILIGLCSGSVFVLLYYYGIINVEMKEDRDLMKKQFESYSTEDLRVMIKANEETNQYLHKEFKNRKDKNTSERLYELVIDLIYSGTVILISGLFYIGAMPSYFHVNDEFINPSNSTLGYTNAFNHIQNRTTQEIFIKLHDIGASNPTLWFWFWWLCVFVFMILPVIKFIYYLIRGKHAKN